MKKWINSLNWGQFLVISILILGIFFRFVEIDRKIFWLDETYTFLRSTGYTEKELLLEVVNGGETHAVNLQKYQKLNPEKNFIDTVKSIAKEEPQHTPLYYVMMHFWRQWFGNSVAAARNLSALISLLAFPSIYWLCLELFASPLTGWLSIALIAISPFHIMYAQEAREYSLWTVTTLVSSAAFVRAMRLNTNFSWFMYTATIVLNLHTFLFSAFLLLGQGIYVAASQGLKFTKIYIAYFLAFFTGLIAISPWLILIVKNSFQVQETTNWSNDKLDSFHLMKLWAFNLSRVFFDIDLILSSKNIPALFLTLLAAIIVVYIIYFLQFKTPQRIRDFLLILITTTTLPLMIADLILGGQRSAASRYLMPGYLGIELSIAYVFTTQIFSTQSLQKYSQKWWKLGMIVLLSGGIISSIFSFPATTWWNKLSDDNTKIAQIINQATHPLVISDSTIGRLLSVSTYLKPQVQLHLEVKCYSCNIDSQLVTKIGKYKIPDGMSDLFLLNPSPEMQDKFQKEAQYNLEIVDPKLSHSFFKILRKNKVT